MRLFSLSLLLITFSVAAIGQEKDEQSCSPWIPNMMGDMSLGPRFIIDNNGFTSGYDVVSTTGVGRHYKASDNNSPIPQSRVYSTFGYFDNTQLFQDLGGNYRDINTRASEFGFELAFWDNLASIQVTLPITYAFDSNVDLNGTDLTSTELGNVAVVLKGLLYQDSCKAISAGIALDTPTANNFSLIDTNNNVYDITNDKLTLSPFIGWTYTPSEKTFAQGFFQVAFPTGNNQFNSFPAVGINRSFEFRNQTMLYADVGVGRWLRQDCCGDGLAVMFELHYSESLDRQISDFNPGLNSTFTRTNDDSFNGTFGATLVRGPWNVNAGFAVPLLDDPDRDFDYGFIFQSNRSF